MAIIGSEGSRPLTKSRDGGSWICFSSHGYAGSVSQTTLSAFAVLQRLSDVALLDVRAVVEVSDGARHS